MSETKTPGSSVFLRTLLIIIAIISVTYFLMAVITHFSLNYKFDDYKFVYSLKAVFDTETAIFKFFIGFVFLSSVWILTAAALKYLKTFLKKK